VPLKPFSSPLVKSTGRLSLRTTQTIKSSAVLTTVMTDTDDREEVKTTSVTKLSAAAIFRTRRKKEKDSEVQENSSKNSAGEAGSEDNHNWSDDNFNLFESVSKELKYNNDGNIDENNTENSANSLDDFQMLPSKSNPKVTPADSSSLDSDKENSPVVDQR